MTIPTTHTIIFRSTGEYLSRFEFFSPEMAAWSHSDAESNARLDDPLKYVNGESCVMNTDIGELFSTVKNSHL